MNFTDIFIRRPVLATVVSLMILVLGLRALVCRCRCCNIRAPQTRWSPSRTTYYGADPDVVAGFITTPLENAIAQANGIDYMTSTSQSGVSTITVNLRLNYDADKALTEINTKINSVLNQLPPGTQQPILSVQIGQTIDAMYIGFGSDVLPPNQITDYLVRVVQPKLQAVAGVQTAEIARRAEFRAARLARSRQARRLRPDRQPTSATALAKNDYISGLGNTKGQMVQVNLTASTDLHSLDEFRNLVVKQAERRRSCGLRTSPMSRSAPTITNRASASTARRRSISASRSRRPPICLTSSTACSKVLPAIQAQLPQG